MGKLYMIGNTHFDPVWLWKWDETMSSITATFRSALKRMEEYPEFIYSFATPPVFEWIKNTDPALFDEIKRRIEEGRWEIAEGWWVQPDCFSASGESYVRQGLYGQRYLMENFGKYANTVFQIDSFGHSIMLPQILSKSKIENYVFVRPENTHVTLQSPLFWWKSPDGSMVKTYRVAKPYDYGETTALQEADDQNEDGMVVYGVTDHGGAPTKRAIEEICRSEKAFCSTVQRFFDEHTPANTLEKELITGDFGPYANITKIKSLNRFAEYAVLNAEKSSVIAGKYKRDELTKCWKDILFNQFHDILGGACIKDAYFDAENMYKRAVATANEILHYNLLRVTNNIKMLGENPDTIWNVVVWNMNASPYDGYVEAELQWMHEFPAYDRGIVLEDEEKNIYECQIIREKSVIPKFRSRILFKAGIPSLGYKAFRVIKTEVDKPEDNLRFDERIETDRYEIILNKDGGGIKSVFDKKQGKMLCQNILIPQCFEDDADTWAFNTKGYGNETESFCFKRSAVIENGIHRTVVKMSYSFRDSIIDFYHTFYKNENYFDVKYKVNWNEKHLVLKLLTDAEGDEHIVSTPYGKVARSSCTRDVPMGEWISACDMSFAADSIFSYNMQNKQLGLTVLRSPIYGDLRMGDIDFDTDYDITEQGLKEGNIRIYLEKDVEIESEASLFHNSPIVLCEACHGGDLPPSCSYLEHHSPNIIVSVVKVCEDDDCIIIRGYETKGMAEEFAFQYSGKEYKVDVNGFEIFTVKICGDSCIKTNMLEDEVCYEDWRN